MAKYEQAKIIGDQPFGSHFGGVYKYFGLLNEPPAFVKKLIYTIDPEAPPVLIEMRKKLIQRISAEVDLLKDMVHENILRFQGTKTYGNYIYIAFEHFDDNLLKFIKLKQGPQREILLKKYMGQLLQGVNYYHSVKQITHHELRPENILIDEINEKVKIADFRLVRLHKLPKSLKETYCSYRAPEELFSIPPMERQALGDYDDEQFGENPHSPHSSDIWSLGCIFAEMILGQPIFVGRNDEERLVSISRLLGVPSEWTRLYMLCPAADDLLPAEKPKMAEKFTEFDAAGVDLLCQMLKWDPEKRITAREALEHEYFTK